MTLKTPTRIRDVLHGYVYLTDTERRIIDHKLFQRLRHIRQNDVAFLVYPSLNTTRFEHSLGCSHVAGRMADALIRTPAWEKYRPDVELEEDEFLQVCRIYGLMHDVGHLPLSHLFETAIGSADWFPGSGFKKPHEAVGKYLSEVILEDAKVPERVRACVLRLMSLKTMPTGDPLQPVKQLVDFEIDADRVDSVARDGLLAGGEYGTYDIERICTAVRLWRQDTGWTLVYTNKAVSSLQGLLLDRCRVHAWVHYHHRVVALKMLFVVFIGWLIHVGVIGPKDFSCDRPGVLAQRDDIWLWSLLRRRLKADSQSQMIPKLVMAARAASLARDTK